MCERRSGSQVLCRTYKKTAGRGKVTARVVTVRAALSGAITNDTDKAERLDALEGCYRVLGEVMDPMWTAWAQFDQGQMRAGAAPKEPPRSVLPEA